MNKEVNNLNLAVVPQDFLLKMEADLNELKEFMRSKNDEEVNSQWIESVKIPKLLGISQKTWQTYRDRRIMPFSQIGSKIYVRRSDIEEFMKAHCISAKR